MEKRETEVTEEAEETTGAGVIAPIVATATAAFTCWRTVPIPSVILY